MKYNNMLKLVSLNAKKNVNRKQKQKAFLEKGNNLLIQTNFVSIFFRFKN